MPIQTPEADPVGGRRHARAAAALALTLATILVGAPAAAREDASPAPNPSSANPNLGPQTAGTAVCTISNDDLDEVTGMVATQNGIYAVEGGTSDDPWVVEVFTIDAATCAADSETYGFDPVDPQDLALGADGALWIADIGLGLSDRVRVTMERVDLATGNDAVPYRALHPSTGPINGTAVLLQADNTPIIIANSGGKAILYRPDGPLQPGADEGLPRLVQVGEFTPVNTDTPTPKGVFGRSLVTGAAVSPDRTRVVVRTASDAYEFKVGADGDIVAAIAAGNPVITPLPDEEDGQAITYSADGTQFLTLSSVPNAVLRSYTPWVPPAAAPPAPSGGGGSGGLDFRDITNIAAVIGFLGLVAVVVGVVGIVRARKQYFARRERGWSEDDDYDEYDADYEDDVPRRAPRPRADARARAGASAAARGGGGGRRPAVDEPARPRPGRAQVPAPMDDDRYGAPPPPPMPPPPPPPPPPPARPRPRPTGSGQVYGGGGQPYGGSGPGPGGGGGGGGGQVYGSGGQVYGSGGGQTYGRPRSEPDEDEPPRRGGYGYDNIDI